MLRHVFGRIGIICLLSLLCVAVPAPAAEDTIVGIWYGELALPDGATLRLALEIAPRADGTFGADLISLDQGADGSPSVQVSFDDPAIRLEFRPPSVVVAGELVEGGQAMETEFQQGGFRAPVSFRRVDHLPGFVTRWQNPDRPFPYNEEEIQFAGGAAGVTLAGTLTLPTGTGPHPAALLVTGSGPQGRDELIGYHRPFLVLADYLTRRGIAVLRYDDRGVGQSTGDFPAATTADLAADALAGLTYLRSRNDIDANLVGIVGHSEGGMIAPMVAAQSPDVSYIVLLAGPGIPILDLMLEQHGLFALEAGATQEQAEALRQVFRVIYEALNTETDENAVYGRSQAYFDGLDETARTSLGWTRGTLNDVIASRLTPWWRYFLRFDPAVYLTQTTCSVLAVNGDHDLNVTASENLAGIDQTLRRAGNTDVTCREFAGLNHMLNRSPVALPGDSLGRGETINSEVLDLVGNWIQRRTGLADPGTAVADHGAALPEELTLAQNYPNPFNPSTTIHYQLDRAGWVTLTVYDPAGQRVTELAAGNQPAGSFSVSWDGHNEAGQPVASGLYLYELRVGEHRSMRKMLLMK